jgi:hypothetical protein
MRRIVLALFCLLAAAAGWSGDYFTLGGMWGYGSNVSEKVDVQKQDLEHRELFLSIMLDEETHLALRGGRIQPKESGESDLDLDYLAMTVSYLFDTPLGITGFYGGPSYYDGEIDHFNPELPVGTQYWTEDVEKLGATVGVEAFFPLSRVFQIYAQLGGHYIPADDEQMTMQLGIGLSIKF